MTENNIDYRFHDYKKEPATSEKLHYWCTLVPWEHLTNKKGLTWKKLSKEQQAEVVDAPSAIKVLLENNSMIKRPIIELDHQIILGFDENEYTEKLK